MKNRASVGRAALSPPPSIGAHLYTAAWGHAALREDVNLGGNAVNRCTSLHGGMGSCRPTGRRQSRGKCRQSVHIVTRRHGVMPPYGKASISGEMPSICAHRYTAAWGHPRPTGKGCSGAPEIHSARQKTHICIFTVQFCRNIYRSGKIYAILRKRTGI